MTMVRGWPIQLAAEVLPPDVLQNGGGRDGSSPGGQFVPIVIAALLVLVPLVFLLAYSTRRKRKRKVHLPRNPTLAETGGLPPRRQT